MKPIFPKSLDFLIRAAGAFLGFSILTGVAAYTYFTLPVVQDTGYRPEQPVPYSHKLHAGNLNMDCYYCHNTVAKAAHAAIPSTETCMNCHTRVKSDSALLAPVRKSYATGEPVKWVKVHNLPDYAYFNHSAHVTAGVSCVSCHGRVDQMVEITQVQPLNIRNRHGNRQGQEHQPARALRRMPSLELEGKRISNDESRTNQQRKKKAHPP